METNLRVNKCTLSKPCFLRSLSSAKITQTGFRLLLETLKEYNPRLIKLEFHSIELTDEWMKPLCEYLQSNNVIEELSLSRNKITDKGVEMLSESLMDKSSLQKLNLRENYEISDISIPNLQKIIESSGVVHIEIYSFKMMKGDLIEAILKIKKGEEGIRKRFW